MELKLVPTGIKDQHKQLGMVAVAAQSKSSFMLVLCSREIPAKANKLILSYLILSYKMEKERVPIPGV